jgi:hypothetical protein
LAFNEFMSIQPATDNGQKPIRTFIALPVYGIDPVHVQCLLGLVQDKRLNGEIHFEIGDSSPSRARNNLVQRFLERDCDQLLFIDSDIVFTPNQVLDICSRRELVVGAPYFAKQDGPVKPILNGLEPGKVAPIRPDGLQEVRYMGTGFLLIKRCVFEMIMRKQPELAYQRDEAPPGTINWAFFEEKVHRFPDGFQRFLTEDWLFCPRCLDLGIPVYCDMREQMALQHRGTVSFPLQSQRQNLFGPMPAPGVPAASPLPVVPAGTPRLASDAADSNMSIVPRGTIPATTNAEVPAT